MSLTAIDGTHVYIGFRRPSFHALPSPIIEPS
jgi:hypothetical protein